MLERLIDTLLYEGYALYPYTPGTTKNATPTPFGIVYPPAYAAELASAFDHLELRGELAEDADVAGEVHFLDGAGERHDLGPGEHAVAGLRVRVALTREGRRVCLRVENLTEAPAGLDRAGALQRSLLSTHPVLHGPFRSPLDVIHSSVNTWPVLAHGALLGAAIILPDNPRLAPESRGSLFDSTEIEEALLLHVQVLTESERAEIADPRVKAMIERAVTASPEEILALHGRTTLRDPRAGEASATVGDVTFRPGDHVRLRPRPDADLQARLLDGRTATIERLYYDHEDKLYFAVTVDGDPGQDLMRETGRYLFFFAPEVEALP
jgi:hypothetical protein